MSLNRCTVFLQSSGLSEAVVVNMTSNCTDSKPLIHLHQISLIVVWRDYYSLQIEINPWPVMIRQSESPIIYNTAVLLRHNIKISRCSAYITQMSPDWLHSIERQMLFSGWMLPAFHRIVSSALQIILCSYMRIIKLYRKRCNLFPFN